MTLSLALVALTAGLALAFERADPGSITEAEARRWTRRSRVRFPLDLVTCGALLAAVIAAARVA